MRQISLGMLICTCLIGYNQAASLSLLMPTTSRFSTNQHPLSTDTILSSKFVLKGNSIHISENKIQCAKKKSIRINIKRKYRVNHDQTLCHLPWWIFSDFVFECPFVDLSRYKVLRQFILSHRPFAGSSSLFFVFILRDSIFIWMMRIAISHWLHNLYYNRFIYEFL